MIRLPRIIAVDEITQVTFYSWSALKQCVLKGAGRALRLSAALPDAVPTRELLIGRFHHAILHLAATIATREELSDAIEHQIEVLQAEADTWPHLRKYGSVSGWDQINTSATVALSARNRGVVQGHGVVSRPEEDLVSTDQLLCGRPDFFSVRGTAAVLREYKSGTIREADGSIKKNYLDQLYFYAALIYDNHAVETIQGRIESLSGDCGEAKIQRSEAEAFSDRVRTDIRDANVRIRSARGAEYLEDPGVEACNYCDKQIVCVKYQRQQDTLRLPGEQRLLKGRVVRKAAHDDGRVVELTLEVENASHESKIAIPTELASSIQMGGLYVIAGLQLHGGQLRWSSTSRLFSNA